jgi:hypothetical protein
MPDEKTSLAYIDRLTEAVTASGMTQTFFGMFHFKDPNFLSRARRGVRWQKKTIEQVNKVLGEYGQ